MIISIINNKKVPNALNMVSKPYMYLKALGTFILLVFLFFDNQVLHKLFYA